MKRAIPQKIKSVSAVVANSDAVPGQSKPPLPEVNRRAGTSAAVIGLAISVGAHCLLLPRQGDSAVAAEPVSSDAATDVAVLSPDVAVPASVSAGSVREHIVQEGQTLWQIAVTYQVDAASLASLNRLSLDAVLRVGQVIQVPTDVRVANRSDGSVVSDSPSYYGIVQGVQVSAGQIAEKKQADEELKVNQQKSVATLKQARENLKLSLNRLGAESAKPSSAAPIVVPVVPVTPDDAVISQPSQPQVEQTVKTDPAKVGVYKVAPGDTLSAIARSHGISQEALAKANRIADPNFLLVGQSLKITSTGKVFREEKTIASPTVGQVDRSETARSLASVLPQSDSSQQAAKFQPRIANLPAPVAMTQSEDLSNSDASASETLKNLATGDAQVAVAPFAVSPASETSGGPDVRYSYVENLRNEIIQMREKFRKPLAAAPNSGIKVAAASLSLASLQGSSRKVNPELQSVRAEEVLSSQAKPSTQATDRQSTTATLQKTKPQVVAVAPIGSQNYEPLVPSSLGRIVSPDLPSIGPSETYLPRTPNRFAGYIWPARGVLTSGYGWRWGRMHRGIDVAGPVGTPIVAAASGVVITSGWNSGGYGNMVEIKHPDGSVTLYAHNSRNLVRVGQNVDQGQQIAEMGSTGFSTGPHSHFEVHLPGQGAVNPMAFLPRSGA